MGLIIGPKSIEILPAFEGIGHMPAVFVTKINLEYFEGNQPKEHPCAVLGKIKLPTDPKKLPEFTHNNPNYLASETPAQTMAKFSGLVTANLFGYLNKPNSMVYNKFLFVNDKLPPFLRSYLHTNEKAVITPLNLNDSRLEDSHLITRTESAVVNIK